MKQWIPELSPFLTPNDTNTISSCTTPSSPTPTNSPFPLPLNSGGLSLNLRNDTDHVNLLSMDRDDVGTCVQRHDSQHGLLSMEASSYTPANTATDCDALQHTATHCNTLQHTPAHTPPPPSAPTPPSPSHDGVTDSISVSLSPEKMPSNIDFARLEIMVREIA